MQLLGSSLSTLCLTLTTLWFSIVNHKVIIVNRHEQATARQTRQILGLLVEGNSLRATSRLADCSINTVTRLLVDVGTACSEYQDRTLRSLPCKRLPVDEIWSFVYAKEKNVPEGMEGEAGDIWTWTVMDADTKLIPSWLVGNRSLKTARMFIGDLASRLASLIQLNSDGYEVYINAVEHAFAGNVDFALVEKIYGLPTATRESSLTAGHGTVTLNDGTEWKFIFGPAAANF